MQGIWKIGPMALVAALGLAGVGCGDDDGDGGDPGVDPNKLVSDLTPTEEEALCAEFGRDATAELGDTTEFECTVVGLFASLLGGGGTVAACETARDACIDDGGPPPGEEVLSCDYEEAGADCDATVAEMRACVDAQIALAATFIDDITCALVMDPTSIPDPQLPAACTSLADKCPLYEESPEE